MDEREEKWDVRHVLWTAGITNMIAKDMKDVNTIVRSHDVGVNKKDKVASLEAGL
jgi:hypothetical protein